MDMYSIDDIKESGFKTEGLALSSLRIALKSFFETYYNNYDMFSSIKHSLEETGEMQDTYLHTKDYYESYFKSIIHFQHFFELTYKEILREVHPYLASRSYDNPLVYFKILTEEKLSFNEEENLYSVELSEAIKILSNLAKNKKIDEQYEFLVEKDNLKTINTVNNLRNRIWHRGIYVIRYDLFDQLVAKYILPIIKKTLSLSFYNNREKQWKYEYLHCDINIIDEIIDTYRDEKKYNKVIRLNRMAFLKELGRAAYINPVSKQKYITKGKEISTPYGFTTLAKVTEYENHKKLIQKEKEIKFITENHYEFGCDYTSQCPVCGLDAIVENKDDIFLDEFETIEYIYEIECKNCGFILSCDVENPSSYGFSDQNYFDIY